MKRFFVGAAGLYVALAGIGRLAEEMGATRCPCEPNCWCKKPGLSVFRWVGPFGHRIAPADDATATASPS